MKSGNKKRVLSVALCLAVLAGLVMLGNYVRLKQTKEYPLAEDAKEGGYQLPELAYQEQLAQMEQSYFRIQINASPTVDSGSGRCNLMIGNPKENQEDVIVYLLMDETGDEIYRSEVVKPGERSPYAVFDTIPDPGEYKVTAVFCILQQGSTEVIGEIEAGIMVTVEP